MLRNLIRSLFLLILTATAAEAVSPTPLPTAPLVAEDDTSILASQLGREGQWLLVLIRSGSGAGETLLDFLAGLEQPLPSGKLVIVVSDANSKTLAAMRVRRAPLASASWRSDSGGRLADALGLKASPALLGIQGGTATWSVTGLPGSLQMEQMMRGWVGE
jgi:hypothetical protein